MIIKGDGDNVGKGFRNDCHNQLISIAERFCNKIDNQTSCNRMNSENVTPNLESIRLSGKAWIKNKFNGNRVANNTNMTLSMSPNGSFNQFWIT